MASKLDVIIPSTAIIYVVGLALNSAILYRNCQNHLPENRPGIAVIANRDHSENKAEEIFISYPTNHPALPGNFGSDKALIMVYAENLGGADYKLPVPVPEYLRFKQMSHYITESRELVNWVTYDHSIIKDFARGVTKGISSSEEKARLLLDFVHTHFYDIRIENRGQDYVRYPLETMVERNGDCEDLAILAASLMKAIDIDVALLSYPEHVALGVTGNFEGAYFSVNEKKYFYAEATGTHWLHKKATWKIGQIPSGYKSRKAQVLVVK